MITFKDIQIDLFKAMERHIEAFFRWNKGQVSLDEIIGELGHYYTFDELMICMDDIEYFLEELEAAHNGN